MYRNLHYLGSNCSIKRWIAFKVNLMMVWYEVEDGTRRKKMRKREGHIMVIERKWNI